MTLNRKVLTLIGDSTIDNKKWVKNKGLSVVQHLSKLLESFVIHDLTNDGFTSSDCLHGAYRDKAVTGDEFPHVKFSPLKDGADNIKQSDYIILSIGGNDFREFLQSMFVSRDKQKYLQEKFARVMQVMQSNYLKIFEHLSTLNPTATIILMTQYYPSRKQEHYQIYEFMNLIRQSLDIGKDCKDEDSMAQKIMKLTYENILKQIKPEKNNCIVANITSSLDPYDILNHVCQIEPSNEGGRKIAEMLATLVTMPTTSGMSYQFLPTYFDKNVVDRIEHIKTNSLTEWNPCHPKEIASRKISSCASVTVRLSSGLQDAKQALEKKQSLPLVEAKLFSSHVPVELAKHAKYFEQNDIKIAPRLIKREQIIQDLKANMTKPELDEDTIVFYQMVMAYTAEIENISNKKCYELFAKLNLSKDTWSTALDILKESREASMKYHDNSLLNQLIASVNQGSLTSLINDRLHPKVITDSEVWSCHLL